MTNVEQAVALVTDGMTLGLGSGHAAERFIAALGERVRTGLQVRGVPTSEASADLAARVGVPLVELRNAMPLDITFDGADEVDPALNLLKGYGNALVREKIVTAASRKLVVLIGPENVHDKLVDRLGQRGQLPIEVVPFALPLVEKRLANLGFPAETVRSASGDLLSSDNGNHVLRLRVAPIDDPSALEQTLRAIPGVIATGLFLAMADTVMIEDRG